MPDHRIHMKFFVRGPFHNQISTNTEVWMCTFYEMDLATAIGRQRMFGSEAKLRELIRRTSTPLTETEAIELDTALSLGRGSVNLTLTETQYRTLKGLNPERTIKPVD